MNKIELIVLNDNGSEKPLKTFCASVLEQAYFLFVPSYGSSLRAYLVNREDLGTLSQFRLTAAYVFGFCADAARSKIEALANNAALISHLAAINSNYHHFDGELAASFRAKIESVLSDAV